MVMSCISSQAKAVIMNIKFLISFCHKVTCPRTGVKASQGVITCQNLTVLYKT